MAIPQSSRVLNFAVVGERRCGAGVLQASISMHPKAVCHGPLLHEDPKIRQMAHEAYYGPKTDGISEWLDGAEISAEQYLVSRVFDHPCHGEHVLGVVTNYSDLTRHALWEHLRERDREGDFVTIHVRRNPLACFISWKQAGYPGNEDTDGMPCPVFLNPREVTAFCRDYAADESRVSLYADDRLEIEYAEIVTDYPRVMRGVFDFLELSALPNLMPPMVRGKNRRMRERVCNFTEARAAVPAEVRAYFDDPYFI